jgi:FixJ family two-component response regulator
MAIIEVVDDDSNLRTALYALLTMQGYRITL